MKKLLQWLFRKPVMRLAEKISSAPKKDKVFSSLSKLVKNIQDPTSNCGVTVPFDLSTGKFIIFSDQHKGARDLADDFRVAEKIISRHWITISTTVIISSTWAIAKNCGKTNQRSYWRKTRPTCWRKVAFCKPIATIAFMATTTWNGNMTSPAAATLHRFLATS